MGDKKSHATINSEYSFTSTPLVKLQFEKKNIFKNYILNKPNVMLIRVSRPIDLFVAARLPTFEPDIDTRSCTHYRKRLDQRDLHPH